MSETELMEAGLLFMLNLKARSTGDVQAISSLGMLLLRRDRLFNHPKIETLIPIHQALQILLEQSITLDRLINKNAEAKTIANPGSANSRSIHSEQQPGPIDYALDQSGVTEQVSDPLCLGSGLTPRQCEVIRLLMRGNGTRTIAQSIGCSKATVRKHLENLYRRLGVQTRTAAIAYILGKIGIV